VKPGERIRLIKESTDSLLERPWPEAQLTLDQFGFTTFEDNSFDFDLHYYFLEQIKQGNDAELTALHEYLVGEDAAPISNVTG
jgi:hypothetical protein